MIHEFGTFGCMISCHLLRLPLAASQRLASLLLLLMLMMLLRLVMLMVVMALICWGWTVDNPQTRTALGREGTAAVFIVSMSKLSRVVVD